MRCFASDYGLKRYVFDCVRHEDNQPNDKRNAMTKEANQTNDLAMLVYMKNLNECVKVNIELLKIG